MPAFSYVSILLSPIVPADIELTEHRLDGIQYKHVAGRSAVEIINVKSVEIILHLGVMLIPRRLMEDRCGIVALRLTLHCIPGKVLTAEIYSE